MYVQKTPAVKDDETGIILKYLENTLHDIKTPLSIIFSILQSLELKSDLDLEVKDQILKMKRCCYKISKLIQDVNDSGRIAGGRFNPKYINYDIVFLAESITQSVSPLADRKNIEIIFDTNIEEKIMALDKNIFERILLNLLSNAIKFSKHNSVIQVNLYCSDDIMSMDIIDGGYGISSERLDSIFNRYEYSDTPSNQEGSGIGLDIVKGLIYALNGKITARQNINNSGATIHFHLPVFTVEEEPEETADFYNYSSDSIFQMELSDHMTD